VTRSNKNSHHREKIMHKILVSLAVLALGAPVVAGAVPMTVDFTVTTTMSQYGGAITSGYQSGVVGSGFFTFDDSIRDVPAVVEGIAAIDLSVSWLGATWDESTARIGNLTFNPDGSLRNWLIGGWYQGDCGLGCVYPNGPSDFWVGTTNGVFSSLIHLQGVSGYVYASTAWSVRQVPEPGMATLMLMGLIGGWAARRRTGRSA
jgi:hypothetical protein